MSRSSRRLSFAAPFILVAALPACKHSSAGGGGPDPIHKNPPAQTEPYASWNVSMYDGACQAEDATPFDCPPDASCNPPPPMSIACPEGMTEDASMKVVQMEENGPCYVEKADGDAAETDCPSWGE